MKLTDSERQEFIKDLKALYNQNLDFITAVRNGTAKKQYGKDVMKEFGKLNEQLDDYIQDVDHGLEIDKTLEDWCELLADTLLDDDNFYIDEDGFSWH